MNPVLPVTKVVAPALETARVARLAKNAVSNLLRLGTGWLTVLLVPPLLVHSLDKPAYATWMLVLQLGAYATLLDGGLQMAIGRFVAQAEHTGDRKHLGEILSSAAALLSGAAVLVLMLVLLGSAELGRFRSIPHALLPQASLALLIVGGSLALAFPSSVLAGLSLGLEKNHINALAGGLSRLAGAAGMVWAAVHHRGLVVMALWTAMGTLLQPMILLAGNHSHGLGSLLRTSLVRAHTLWEFARFCLAMVVSQFGMLLISGLDLPIVVAYDFRNAGYYAIAATASNLIAVPHGAILSTLVPRIASMSMGDQAERMGQVLLRTTRLSTAMLALIAVPLTLGMPTLLRLWVGADYARHALVFAEVLVAAQVVRLTLMPYAVIGFSAGEQSRMLVSPSVEAVVNFACSLVLVRWMGAAGVTVGTLIGAVVGVGLHFSNSMRRTRGIIFSRKDLLLQGILQPIAWSLPTAILLAGALPLFSGTPAKLLLLGGGFVITALLLWKAVLRPEDRLILRELRSRLVPVVRPERNVT